MPASGTAPADSRGSGRSGHDALQRNAAAPTLGEGRDVLDAQLDVAPADPLGGDQGDPDARAHSVPAESVEWARLFILADTLDDLERLRIATENRVRAAEQTKGLAGTPALESLTALVDATKALEHQATLDVQRTMRAHPLGGFATRTVGVGHKQLARLLATVGDPAWNAAEVRPRRGPAELWAYCGYVPGQRRRKGVKSNWNSEAKMRAYLIAESCVKQRSSPYRPVYDAARANWADHDVADGHKHAHALRLVAKAVLRDLWKEARAQLTSDFATSSEVEESEAAN
jgi:hypothetical protein